MMKKFLYIAAFFGALAGCRAIDDAELIDVREFAASKEELIVADGGGISSFKVYSNGKVSVGIVESGADWLELSSAASFKGDGDVEVLVSPNGGSIRMATIRLTLDGGASTLDVPVRQEGLPQYLVCREPYCIVDGRSDVQQTFTVVTNVPEEQISCDVEYLGLYKGWISEVGFSAGTLAIKALANESDVCRRARCLLKYTDNWGRDSSLELFVTQTDRDGSVGKSAGITLIKALGSFEGTLIQDDFTLDGIIVSDCTSPNMALNPAVCNTGDKFMADTTFARRVAYLEAADGSWGLRLIFNDEADNALRFGTAVSLSLYGLTAIRESNPQRFTLSGVSGWNICSSSPGAAVPEKLRSLSGLTPEDVYTYVTLEDMEFAFKKGTYADVMEDFAIQPPGSAGSGSKGSLLDGWASLLVDASGAGIYAPVNMLCPWRRTGGGVPQGVGQVRGILVHEDMPRLGNAGTYQIRVLDESGFAMDSESSLHEHAVWINSYANRSNYSAVNSRYAYNKLATVIPSNDLLEAGKSLANGEMISENVTYPDSKSDAPYTTANCYNRLTADNDGVSSDYVGIGDIMMTRDFYRWNSDGEVEGYNGFVFTFRPAEVETSHWEFAFEFAGGYNSAGTARSWPAHWCLECSTDGGDSWTLVPEAATGAPYVHMRGLPWVRTFLNGQWYQTPSQAGMGFSQHSYVLPPEVAGKEQAMLRLRPYDKTIVSLPLLWDDDIEVSEIDYTTGIDVRVRFGFIYIRYR